MTPQSRCVECDEAITNPICPGCLDTELTYWVSERDESLIDSFRNNNVTPLEEYFEETQCVVCGNRMNLCAHCFCKDALEFIKERNPGLVNKFIRHFDFELIS
ncbi:hypothetical protein HQ529_00510 [Candidatus Woesearchaeota archaeon]|nr:hypothetical protein [Candidatus Woesearchaeota archaeon]